MKKMAAGLVLVCMTAWCLGGCAKNPAQEVKNEVTYPTEISDDDWEKKQAYWEENEVDETFLNNQKIFAFKTAQNLLAGRTENGIYSPVGFYYALTLAVSGTAGETAGELYDFLECTDRDTALSEAGKLYRILYEDGDIGKLHIATSLWVDKKVNLKEEFKKNAQTQLYASSHLVDFSDEAVYRQMGDWVKEQTKGTIAPEFKPVPEQVMSILNTVYFYDQWIDKFNKSATKKDVFHMADGSGKETDFMNGLFGSHGFSRGGNFTRSSLPLKGNSSMVFVLPEEGVSVEEFLKSPETLQEALEGGNSHMGEVTFKVPKFAMDSSFDLKKMMESMGISKIFADGDFSAMTDDDGICVNKISQDGHISINEKGVEASAFTQIDYAGASVPDGKAEMILDRPFLYGIQNQGVWVFIGICDNPGQ